MEWRQERQERQSLRKGSFVSLVLYFFFASLLAFFYKRLSSHVQTNTPGEVCYEGSEADLDQTAAGCLLFIRRSFAVGPIRFRSNGIGDGDGHGARSAEGGGPQRQRHTH